MCGQRPDDKGAVMVFLIIALVLTTALFAMTLWYYLYNKRIDLFYLMVVSLTLTCLLLAGHIGSQIVLHFLSSSHK
jgi:hypothetical protein